MHADLLTPTHVFLGLLIAASLTAIFTRFINVPYSVALVLTGLGVTFLNLVPHVHMTPELVMLVFLPGLLFEASWNMDFKVLKQNWLPIGAMATIGVLLCTLLVGLVLSGLGGFDWKLSLVFGAMVAATDPVSVVAMFRKLGVPKRLTMLLEGESLLNDGTAVVVFRIVAGMVAAGTSLSVVDTVTTFVTVISGGVVIGAATGFFFSWVTKYFDDHSLEITLTVIAAYGSYFLAEHFSVSPVIAVVTAGLIIGNYGSKVGMSPTTRLSVTSFWEYMAFLINSVLFILVGSTIEISGLIANSKLIAIAVVAVLLARAVAVYGLSKLCAGKEAIPLKWQHIIFWGGLRGALSMALALSLPTDFPHRTELLHMTFGVVIFTLLVKGLTIEPLVKWLKLRLVDPNHTRYQEIAARLMAIASQQDLLDRHREAHRIGQDTYAKLTAALTAERETSEHELNELKTQAPQVARYELQRTKREMALANKESLQRLFKDGQLTEEQLSELTIEIDSALEKLDQ